MLALLVSYAAFGIAGGFVYRVLASRSRVGFSLKHWALLGAAIGGAMMFARFVINKRGIFGAQSETLLVVGAMFLVGGFLSVAWLIPWLFQRRT